MRGDPALEIFLGRWLTSRFGEAAAAKTARALQESVAALTRGDLPAKFPASLTSRIAHLHTFVARLDEEGNHPPAPAGSLGALWLKNARRVLVRWDEANWTRSALDLSGEKNPFLLTAVSQSLEESFEPAQASDREVAEHLRKLRTLDESASRSVPVPPGPQAPWEPSRYLFPAASRPLFEALNPGIAELVAKPVAGAPWLVPARTLAELLRWIDGGWPVPASRLEGALRPLANLLPAQEGGLLAAVREALRRVSPEAVVPQVQAEARDDAPASGDEVRRRAGEHLDALARALQSGPSAEGQAFGRRLEETHVRPAAATAPGLHQELVGCLAFLDAAEGPSASSPWRRDALERLARIAQDLGGGAILNEQLLERPLSAWTEFVTVVGNDDQAPPGEPRRITRVERIGYLLIFTQGERKVLVRARVRIAD